ncbi:TPA: restriction endonuclease, partial [Neisseria meningitidis]
TETSKDQVNSELIEYINNKSNGMEVIINRYKNAIEEIITINELNDWLNELCNCDIDKLLKDIDLYYKLELNLLANDE